MKRSLTILLTLLAITFLPLRANAQPTATSKSQFQWDHDGVNLNHFEVNFDFVAWTNNALIKSFNIPATLALGLHTFYVRACATADSSTCSDPASIQFTLINPNLPGVPTNLRIVIVATTVTPVAPAAKPATRLPVPPPIKSKNYD